MSKIELETEEETNRRFYGSRLGVLFAMIVMLGNGVHPIINSARPADFESLLFGWLMSTFEFGTALVFYYRQHRVTFRNSSKALVPKVSISAQKKYLVLALIGIIFSVATYYYIEGLTLTGSISGAVALKTAPIYAFFLGLMFLGEKPNGKQLLITSVMLFGIYFLATQGTFQLENLSIGFIYLLIVPFLWTVGHAITKPFLERCQFHPLQVIFFRSGIVAFALFLLSLNVYGVSRMLDVLLSPLHLLFAMAMGIVYFLVHFCWYKTITTIKLSLASALVIPSPAITMLLAIFLLGDPLYSYQVISMLLVFFGLYLLLYLKMKHGKKRTECLGRGTVGTLN